MLQFSPFNLRVQSIKETHQVHGVVQPLERFLAALLSVADVTHGLVDDTTSYLVGDTACALDGGLQGFILRDMVFTFHSCCSQSLIRDLDLTVGRVCKRSEKKVLQSNLL